MLTNIFLPIESIDKTVDIQIPVMNENIPAKLKLRYKKGQLKANLHLCNKDGNGKLDLFYPRIASEFKRQAQLNFSQCCHSRYLPDSLLNSQVSKWCNDNAKLYISYETLRGLKVTEHKKGGIRIKATNSDLNV
ncbi:hypothetical protein [Photobacterium sp. DNB22_13_2]